MKEKKQEILRTALELFVNNGFSATPTAAVAQKAKVANGTLFHYFPTKEKLICALYVEVKNNFVLSITENYNKDAEFRDRMKTIWSNIIQWAVNTPTEFQYIRQFLSSQYSKGFTHEQLSAHDLFLSNLLNEGCSKNIFLDLPVELLVQISMSQVYGLIEYIYLHPELLKNPAVMNLAFESFWNSLSK